MTSFYQRHELIIGWLWMFSVITITDAVISGLTGGERIELVEALVLALGGVVCHALQSLKETSHE